MLQDKNTNLKDDLKLFKKLSMFLKELNLSNSKGPNSQKYFGSSRNMPFWG